MFASPFFDLDQDSSIQFLDNSLESQSIWVIGYIESLIEKYNIKRNDAIYDGPSPFEICIKEVSTYYMTFYLSHTKYVNADVLWKAINLFASHKILLNILFHSFKFRDGYFLIGEVLNCVQILFNKFFVSNNFKSIEEKDLFYDTYFLNFMSIPIKCRHDRSMISFLIFYKQFNCLHILLNFLEENPKYVHLVKHTCYIPNGTVVYPHHLWILEGNSPDSEFGQKLIKIFGDS